VTEIINWVIGTFVFVVFVWAAWRIGTLERGHVEDAGAKVADERIDSIRQSLDGDRAELRASDFAALEPHTHIRAGTRNE